MNTRLRNVLAASLALAGLALSPLSPLQPQRDHTGSKADAVASAQLAALQGRAGPAACDEATGTATVQGVSFECNDVDLLSFVPADELLAEVNGDVLTGGGVSDVWAWVDPRTGDEYVLVGVTTGVAALRVTDPTDPEYLGHVLNTGAQLIWFDVKVDENYAFMVSESPAMGMKILDLRLLRDLQEVPPNTTVPLPVTTYPLDLVAHNVVIDTDADMLYLVGSGAALGFGSVCTVDADSATDNAGLHAIDISQPLVPVYEGCHSEQGYVHDANCDTYTGPDAEHHGKQICITAHEDGVAIVDTTDPANMVTLSATTDEDYPRVAYSHQGWMSEDQHWYFHGDELDEGGTEPTRTFVFDIRDLDDIALHFVNEPGGVNIDHNMYTHEGLLYQSNYTAGLQVFDTSGVADGVLPLIAEFDVWPDDGGTDPAEFSGSWSNYPYLPSGTIPVTSIADGLFLLDVHDDVAAGDCFRRNGKLDRNADCG